ETRSGIYWVATEGGVCRFNPLGSPQARGETTRGKRDAPASEPMFVLQPLGADEKNWAVYVLIEDHMGAIWCGTNNGVYRLEPLRDRGGFRFVEMGMPKGAHGETIVQTLLEDRQGALWAGFGGELYRRRSDGRTECYTIRHSAGIKALLED